MPASWEEAKLDWNAIQAVAESAGAIGVIVSLLYVARQLSHNTRVNRVSANQDLTTHYNSIPEFAKLGPHGARAYTSMFSDEPDEFSLEERTTERAFTMQALAVFEHAFLRVGCAGFPRHYPSFSPFLTSGFRAFVDQVHNEDREVIPDFLRRRQSALTQADGG